MENKELSKFQLNMAERISAKIKTQHEWVSAQEQVVFNAVIGEQTPFDLRQCVQALETGKSTLKALKVCFEEAVGVDYDTYCVENITAKPVVTAEDKLLAAIKELLVK